MGYCILLYSGVPPFTSQFCEFMYYVTLSCGSKIVFAEIGENK